MNELFLGCLSLLLVANLWWGIKKLPKERWQILAAIPRKQAGDGSWQGINFTYYGLFNANAYILAVLLFLVLLKSTGAHTSAILISIGCIIGCCAPASRFIARLVEKKSYTFTVGGASFLGLLLAPPFFLFMHRLSVSMDTGSFNVAAALAALTISYTLGEGLGRLACISFGCCYGKSIDASSRLVRKIFSRHHACFEGKTKKVSYEGNLDGQPLIPVQAITCALFTTTALVGIAMFLHGAFVSSYLLPLCVTQSWRIISEFLRADFRGGGRLTVYQKMAFAGLLYGIGIALLLPYSGETTVNLALALSQLWSPAAILLMQLGWLAIFIYTGKSMITGSHISFHVHQNLS